MIRGNSLLLALLYVSLGIGIGWTVNSVRADPEKPAHVYEMRTYTTEPNRLPNLHARFKDHTMKLFEKHGMKNVIYLTPIDGEGKAIDNKLVYLLAHKSQADAKASFDAFGQDPDWKAVQKESQKDGKIVSKVDSQFYVPTEYSPIK